MEKEYKNVNNGVVIKTVATLGGCWQLVPQLSSVIESKKVMEEKATQEVAKEPPKKIKEQFKNQQKSNGKKR